MKLLTLILASSLLLSACEKNDPQETFTGKFPIEDFTQKRIYEQFAGVWLGNGKEHEFQYYFFYLIEGFYAYEADEEKYIVPPFLDQFPTYNVIYGATFYFEDGPECDRGTVYKLIIKDHKNLLICKYNGLMYVFSEGQDPNQCVGNPKYEFTRIINMSE